MRGAFQLPARDGAKRKEDGGAACFSAVSFNQSSHRLTILRLCGVLCICNGRLGLLN